MEVNDELYICNKKIVNRVSRIIGHTESIKRMCVQGKDSIEIITQIAAVKASLNSLGKIILKQHINACLLDVANKQDEESIKKLNIAIEKLIK